MKVIKPVYCQNCKYYLNTGFESALSLISHQSRNPHQCWHPNNLYTKHTPITKSIYIKEFATEKNKNNTCNWYQRIWYKFWIKGDK